MSSVGSDLAELVKLRDLRLKFLNRDRELTALAIAKVYGYGPAEVARAIEARHVKRLVQFDADQGGSRNPEHSVDPASTDLTHGEPAADTALEPLRGEGQELGDSIVGDAQRDDSGRGVEGDLAHQVSSRSAGGGSPTERSVEATGPAGEPLVPGRSEAQR